MPEHSPESLTEAVQTVLQSVNDPEIGRPITDLGMVGPVGVQLRDDAGAVATIEIKLTVAGCPMRSTLVRDVTAAAKSVDGIGDVVVNLGVMTAQERAAVKTKLRGTAAEPEIPFAKADSLTKVIAIASGKGGVGKSSLTANLAAAMAADGLSVGVIDADIYGFSIPRMLGVDQVPTSVDGMILPPQAHGVKVVSIGMFVPPGRPVVWRGPMLHRALQQFLADAYWGDLDVLLLDLPPGTGDVAISIAQLLPGSDLLVVTTPQIAAAEVAERAGAMAMQTRQKVVGVVENMSWLIQPDGSRLEVFGSGGGESVATSLSQALHTDIPLIGQIPLDIALREAGDDRVPVVISAPDSPAAVELRRIARELAARPRGLEGRSLGVSVV